MGRYADPGDAEAFEIMRGYQHAGWGGTVEFDGHTLSDQWRINIGQYEGWRDTPLDAVKSITERIKAKSPITADHLYGLDPEDPVHCCSRPEEAHPRSDPE